VKLTRRQVNILVFAIPVLFIAALVLFAPTGPSIQLANGIREGTTREEAIMLLGQPDSEFPIGEQGGTILQWELLDGRVSLYVNFAGRALRGPSMTKSSLLERWWADVREKAGF
jgi:hypothetical protein